ncbi:MAG: protein kinase domain-containing protein [Gemmatimonadaceae bacterium]
MRDRVVAAVGDLYDVRDEVGRGGMAIVYRALDVRLRRHVAIKVLPPEYAFRRDVKERFLREAQTAAQLSHPNIVPIYSVDERDGLVYFAMALVDGESLAQRLATGERLSFDDVRRILHDVGDALAYAHARGVVHRDIKPDNILLDRETGRPMVTDFGIAHAAEADSRLTVTGVAVGTPAYMSPEQALGEREVDGRSDIYSLGIVGYQLLAGELPFRANNTPSMMMKHISELPRPLAERRRDVPAVLARTVERAHAKKPEDRWPDAGAFRDALLGVDAAAREVRAQPRPPASFPSSPARSDAPPSRREQRQLAREQHHAERHARKLERRERKKDNSLETFATRPLQDRIRIFRGQVVGTVGTIGGLAAINLMTSADFLWFIFPAIFMSAGLFGKAATLWGDGVGWRDVFGRKRSPEVGQGSPAPPLLSAQDAASKLSPREVLEGPHGGAVRRAATDHAAILAIVERLAKPDRDLLPDVVPTVNALIERVASLAQMLHHLDADATPELLASIEQRIAAVEREPADSADHERRLTLLGRQRATVSDLLDRRARVFAQLESAGLALHNLRLDLLKLRSSGVQAAIQDVNSATIEARALSRDIGHVLEAAEEVRKL